MKKIILLFLGVVVVSSFSFSNVLFNYSHSAINENEAENGKNRIEKEFEAVPGGKIDINLKTAGSISVSCSNNSKVSVKIISTSDEINVNCQKNDDEIQVSSEYVTEENNSNSKVRVLVKVPNEFNVQFSALKGNVELNGIKGGFEGRAVSGNISANNIEGNAELKTVRGNITVKDSKLTGAAHTVKGDITLSGVDGDFKTSSVSGKIKTNCLKREKHYDDGAIFIKSLGGEIEIDSAPHGGRLKTLGGNIKVGSAKDFINANTLGGDISLDNIDGSINAKTLGGNINAKMIGDPESGDRHITLESLGGDITLFVPADLSMNIEVELGKTSNYHGECEVSSDFKFSSKVVHKERNFSMPNRVYSTYKSNVNGGKNKVVIKTTNGNIRIKKL